MKSTTLLLAASPLSSAFLPPNIRPRSTALSMGLFDGVKEAFGADGMGELDGDRETPIDRWMGWNAKKGDGSSAVVGSKGEFCHFIDHASYYLQWIPDSNLSELLLNSTARLH